MPQTPTTTAYLDELEVGAEFAGRGRTITEADLVSFSALTGDWHPQHADAEWARTSAFGERVAHGMMVLSYAVGLLDFDPDRVVALRGLDDVVFKRPVLIGETIRPVARVAEVQHLREDAGLVTLAVQIRGADGRLAARCRIQALWRRDARQAASPGAADASETLEAALHPAADGTVLV